MSTPITWRHAPRTHEHDWSEVTGKPTEFAPTSHTHTQAQVDGLVAALSGKRTIAPMVIGQNVNLNDVTTPGEHSQQFTSWATPELNYPVGVACRVIVAANTSGSQVTQFCIPFTSSVLEIWMRNYYNSWGAWERLPMARDVAAKADANHPALYDSGWRDITALVPATVTSGKVRLMRTGKTVWVDFEALQMQAPPSAPWHAWNGLLPAGFRPARTIYSAIAPTWSRSDTGGQNAPNWAMGPFRADLSGRVIVYDARDADSTTAYPIQGITSFPTPDAAPSSLPGTPA